MKQINPLIQNAYESAKSENWIVAEPFTGGGGSLINMAEHFPGWTFHLNDNNKNLGGLWGFIRSAKQTDFDDLYEQIVKTKIFRANDNQKLSEKQKAVSIDTYRKVCKSTPRTNLLKAYKVIFLNKTSFNGIVTDGACPIGGWEQKSKWPVGIYWNTTDIIKKIERARKALSDRILSVSCEDFESFLKRTKSDFVYADPPYMSLGKNWYDCEFDVNRLQHLRQFLYSCDKWCLSIDRTSETEMVFSEDCVMDLFVHHTAKSPHKKGNKIIAAREMVIFPKKV